MSVYLAVDLGASSGRVMRAELRDGVLDVTEEHRFSNRPQRLPSGLHWDVLELYRNIVGGLRRGAQRGRVDGIGIDGWGVDYALLSGEGLLGVPRHYRDSRSEIMEDVRRLIDDDTLYTRTGIAQIPITTLYRLYGARKDGDMASASTMLMVPDLFTYWLSGAAGTEYTNASTTGLLAAGSREWDADLIDTLGLSPEIFTSIDEPGTLCGHTLPHVTDELGATDPIAVYRVASHDTASAIAAIPADDDAFAYISCGTWSLVGVELDEPLISTEARLGEFSNEVGVEGRTCFHRNNMGLWLLQESMRNWAAAGQDYQLDELLLEAQTIESPVSVIDTGDYRFLVAGDMPNRIVSYCRETGQPEPQSPAQIVRCILDSLALAYADTINAAEKLTGRTIERVHCVGGGSRNELLCQLTADACQRPVLAGPFEATAMGNALMQAMGAGEVESLAHLREIVKASTDIPVYTPRADGGRLRLGAARLATLTRTP